MSKSTKRELRVSDVMLNYLEECSPTTPALFMNDTSGRLASAFDAADWTRRVRAGATPSPWPDGAPFGSVYLRLPKSKLELEFSLAQAHSVLASDGTLYLYGSNDEGIKSAATRLEPYFDRPITELTKGKCRVIRAAPTDTPKTTLEDWREQVTMETPAGSFDMVSYPGLFAHGRLDAGTETLLNHLPKTEGPVHLLDYGCGTGIIAKALQATNPEARMTLFDNDALALEAAKENIPQGDHILGSAVPDLVGTKFDLILSNPPFHTGKDQNFSALEDLCANAPSILNPGGVIRMVVQRTAPVARWLETSFGGAQVIAENKSFRIWEAG